MYGKKRVYPSRARSQSAPARKKNKVALVRTPRWKVLKDPHKDAVSTEFRAKLKYFENFGINPGSGSLGAYVFSANGLYDPNITGAGHQPTGFDQLTAIWSEYVVIGAHIKVWGSHTQTNDAAPPFIFGIFVLDTSSAWSDTRNYIENGNGVYTLVNTKNSDSVKQLQYQADMNQEFGHTVLSDEGAAGSASQNPPEQRYIHITCQPVDYATDMATQYFIAEITYDVIFRDRAKTDIS